MAPEQINGKYAKNHLTDIYSLGHILYFLAVKDDAFHGKVDELLEMTQATPCVRVPPNCQPHVSNALGTIISRATQLHPSDRYQSVIDLRDDLKSYLNGYVIKADRQNLFKRLRSFIKRKKRVIGWSCFVLTLIIGITGYFSSSLLEQKEISQDALALSVDLSEQVSLIKQQEEKFLEVLSREPGIERFLIRSASDIIQQLYEDPSASVLESVEIARELLEKALTINPQLKRPVTLDFCNLLSFNLSEIRPSVVNEVIQGALELCGESQSTYVYGRKNRPSPDVLADFFQKNKELGLLNTQIAELILRYDIECRPDVTWRHNEAITKIIERNNFSRGVVNVNYRRETDTVYITAEKNFSSGMENKRTSRLGRSSMLSLLKAETIQINVKGRCRLLGFDNSNFKTLIFSSCGGIDNEGPILINGLEKVVVPARFKRKGLENIILSTSPNKLKFYYE